MTSTSTSTSSTHSTTTTSPPDYNKTIRELVIDEVERKVKEISKANGYRNDIANVHVGYKFWQTQDLNAISIMPQPDDPTYLTGVRSNVMAMAIIGFAEYNPLTQEPDEASEPLLADLKHNILGSTFSVQFVNGSQEPSQGDLLYGATSNTSVRVMRVNHTTGSWALGNAGGTLRIRDMRRFLSHTEYLKNAAGVVIAKAKLITVEPRFGGYVSNVEYITGGIEGYPEVGETLIAVNLSVKFTYMTMNDNPYLEP